MIFTEQFVFLHVPKTGGTFVRSMLTQAHQAREASWRARLRRARGRPFQFESHSGPRLKHGWRNAIPPEHRDKPILSTLRNPFDRYVSQYEFRWWTKPPPQGMCDHEQARRIYPHFPDLSFAEFVHLANELFAELALTHPDEPEPIGWQTEQFINFHARTPQRYTRKVGDGFFLSPPFSQELAPVHLLRMERLNRDLYSYLREHGFSRREVRFVLDAGRILPKEGGRSSAQTWTRYYTPELLQFVRRRERLLLQAFPEYDPDRPALTPPHRS